MMLDYKKLSPVVTVAGQNYRPALNRLEFLYSGRETVHIVHHEEQGNLPLISYKYFGTPLHWRAIALHNGLRNVLTDVVVGQALTIPLDWGSYQDGVTFV